MLQIAALAVVGRHARAPLPDAFPLLAAHVDGTELQYPDLIWKELCGQMANLVADSGANKAHETQSAFWQYKGPVCP